MRFQLLFGVFVTAPTLLVTGPASAQPADVTFAVPLNLTNLATDITKVRVKCSIPVTGAQSGEQEIAVTARQVVTTAHVIVVVPGTAITPNMVGQQQPWVCDLGLYSASLGWREGGTFLPNDPSPSFRTTQPVPARIGGQFQW